MSNELIKFEEKYVEQFNKLSELKKQMDDLEKIEKSIKEELEKAMDKYGVNSVKTDKITITRVAESFTTSIDLKALKDSEPDCYEGLLEDYPKVTTKKSYIKFTVK